MPLLSLTMRASELSKGTVNIKLDRDYKFTLLKLLHVYHNIDSVNLSDSSDKTQEALLFIRLGGLIENHSQLINYEGQFETFITQSLPNIHNDSGVVIGHGTLRSDNPNPSSGRNTNRVVADINEFYLIPIGASRFNGHNIVSRDVFKTLHNTGGILHFDGQINFEVQYLAAVGGLKRIDSINGGVVTSNKGKNRHNTFITLMFEYEE